MVELQTVGEPRGREEHGQGVILDDLELQLRGLELALHRSEARARNAILFEPGRARFGELRAFQGYSFVVRVPPAIAKRAPFAAAYHIRLLFAFARSARSSLSRGIPSSLPFRISSVCSA